MPGIIDGLAIIITSLGVAPAVAGPLATGLVVGGSSPSFSTLEKKKGRK